MNLQGKGALNQGYSHSMGHEDQTWWHETLTLNEQILADSYVRCWFGTLECVVLKVVNSSATNRSETTVIHLGLDETQVKNPF